MKILQLEIERFGVFNDFQLPLQDANFQLIYGPNEAGKSTLLKVMRYALFGFPHSLESGLVAQQSDVAARGLIELQDGRRVEFRRRKGRKDTLVGQLQPSGVAVNETDFKAILDQATLDLYKNVFGFSLGELREGEKSLRDANLQDVLFGAGIGGLSRFQAVKEQLKKQQALLYLPKGMKGNINRLLANASALRRQVAEATVSPEAVTSRQLAVSTAAERVTQLKSKSTKFDGEKEQALALQKAIPCFRDRVRLLAEMDQYEIPVGLPPDAGPRMKTLRQRLGELQAQLAEMEQEEKDLHDEAERLSLNPPLLEKEAIIRQLHLRAERARAVAADLPVKQQEIANLQEEVAARLAKLNPVWCATDLDKLVPGLAARQNLDQLAEEERRIHQLQTELTAKRQAIVDSMTSEQERLAKLQEIPPQSRLQAILRQKAEYQTHLQRVQETELQLGEIETRLASLLQKLQRPLKAKFDDAENLPLPVEATVHEFQSRMSDLQADTRAEEREFIRIEKTLQSLESELEAINHDIPIPDLQALKSARRHRDEGWNLIRLHVLGTPDDAQDRRWLADSEQSILHRYEEAVRLADEIADRRQEHAQLVTRREETQRQKLKQEAERRTVRQRRQQFQDAELQCQRQWELIWEPAQIQPLAPAAMLKWLGTHDDLVDQHEEKRLLLARLRDLKDRIGDFEDEFNEAFADVASSTAIPERRTGVRQKSENSMLERLTLAEARCDKAQQAEAERNSLTASIAAKDSERQRVERQWEDLERTTREWQQQWQAALTNLHYDPQWDCRTVLQTVDELTAIHDRHQQASKLEKDRSQAQEMTDEFHRNARQLFREIATDLEHVAADQAMGQLAIRFESAQRAADRRQDIESQIAKIEKRRAGDLDKLKATEQQITELLAAARSEDQQIFQQIAENAQLRSQLERQLQLVEVQLETVRGERDKDAFYNSVAQLDPTAIDSELTVITEQVDALQGELEDAMRQHTLAVNDLEALDGTSRAFALQQELEGVLGQLSAEVDRWAPLMLAEAMIERATESFQRDNQSSMLKEVQRLLEQLTCGRYTDVRPVLDGTGKLEIRSGSSAWKEPSQLSDGTREQLYLAIRLAYVLHYCQVNEPLPIIMDDITVNFDDARGRATFELLSEIARDVQVIFLTCHEATVAKATAAIPGLEPALLDSAFLQQI